jgi:hypothetical protein
MKRMMSIAAIALFMAGSSAFACGGCGCSTKKADTKQECKQSADSKTCETKTAEKSSCSSCSKPKA